MSESSEYIIPEGYLFTKDHEWVRIEEDIATVGITDYAQKMMGEIVFVELPNKGKSFNVHDEVAVVESTKTASDVYSPVAGGVIEVNERLESEPDLVNKDCYNAGYICKMKISDMSGIDHLKDPKGYDTYLKGQSESIFTK